MTLQPQNLTLFVLMMSISACDTPNPDGCPYRRCNGNVLETCEDEGHNSVDWYKSSQDCHEESCVEVDADGNGDISAACVLETTPSPLCSNPEHYYDKYTEQFYNDTIVCTANERIDCWNGFIRNRSLCEGKCDDFDNCFYFIE